MTSDFANLGVEHDVEALRKAFGRKVVVAEGTDSSKLRALLTSRNFEIVHFVGYVEPDSGTMVFDQTTRDCMTAEGFKELVELAEVKLVVLATCQAVYLASKLSRSANVVSAITEAPAEHIVTWVHTFYQVLSRGYPVSHAANVANSSTPISLSLHQVQDIAFDR